MKKLITVRHGAHERGALSDLGRTQIAALVPRIKSALGDCDGSTFAVLSSDELRAVQSGEIIAGAFGITNQLDDIFVCDHYDMFADKLLKDEIVRVIESCGADIVIIVTHFEAPSAIIDIFAEKHFNRRVERFETKHGQANLLNLETGEMVFRI